MYCARCQVHFSGSGDEGRCPYCGQEAEASKSTPVAEGMPVPVPDPPPPAADGDRTRTEAPSGDGWTAGSIIAEKYEVISRLGSGGFGSVYKVRHIFRRKHYALKTPHPEFARDEVFRRRFEREIEAMERFVHPDAVMIRDSGITAEGRPYYTMDFIEGESLKETLLREGKLPADRALQVVIRVLRVLEVAHSHGIIHRDIKPDNILLTGSNGREGVKVLDFGVAKLLDLVGESKSITRGDRVGTPKYMSPEQITGEAIEPRSDIFSLGIVFYEMVTGRHPFAQGSSRLPSPGEMRPDPLPVAASILNHHPEEPRHLVPSLPRALNDSMLSMIEKRPRRRPPSAAALLADLEGLAGRPARVTPAAPLRLHPGARRVPARSLVLKAPASGGERRCFLLFDDEVSMGRSNDRERGILNQLILRRLPCRSRAQDPENWRRNLTISHAVATIYPSGTNLTIEPAPGAKHGIGIGGVRSHRTARIQGDRFHLSLGDKAIDLDGYRFAASDEGGAYDLSLLREGRPPDIEARLIHPPRPPLRGVRTGYSNPGCGIDCVSLFRVENWPLHEYHLVYRKLRIGSTTGSALKVRRTDPPAPEALVIQEGGEAFLLALGGGVRIQTAPGSDAVGDAQLPEATLYPLLPGITIALGEESFLVAEAQESDFKTV